MSYIGFMQNTVDAIKSLYNDALYNSKRITNADKEEYRKLLEFFIWQFNHGEIDAENYNRLYNEIIKYDITRIVERRKKSKARFIMWLRVKEVADKLGLGENFIRQAICRAEFRGYCIFARPVMVKYCEEFKLLLAPLVQKHNFKKIRKNKNFKDIKLGDIRSSNNKLRGWTKSAIECYKINCNCENCEVAKIIRGGCLMHETVQKLLTQFGEPDNNINFLK